MGMRDDNKKIELVPGDLEFKNSPNMPDKHNKHNNEFAAKALETTRFISRYRPIKRSTRLKSPASKCLSEAVPVGGLFEQGMSDDSERR